MFFTVVVNEMPLVSKRKRKEFFLRVGNEKSFLTNKQNRSTTISETELNRHLEGKTIVIMFKEIKHIQFRNW